MNTIWNKEKVDTLRQLAESGLPYQDVARQMGLRFKQVESAAVRYKIRKPTWSWNEERRKDILELRIRGKTYVEISRELSQKYNRKISAEAIRKIAQSYGISDQLFNTPDGIKFYDSPVLPMDDYMISCDYHSPYYSELWTNRYLTIARKYEIKKQIIVGDLFDMDFAKSHPITDGEKPSFIEDEKKQSDPLIQTLSWFDETWLVCGNHETRISRITEARVQFSQLVDFFCKDLIQKKFNFTIFDKVQIGEKFLLIHPKSYSQISGATAVRLAEKYHKHILAAHGHFSALRWDRSGKYMGIDIGGMFDQRKIAYVNLLTTTHPSWENGFVVILNGHAYQFHQETDFCWWLNKK
jgi:hypothetical protein